MKANNEGPVMGLVEWLNERAENARRIAEAKRGADRDGWLEDAVHFRQAAALVGIATGAALTAERIEAALGPCADTDRARYLRREFMARVNWLRDINDRSHQKDASGVDPMTEREMFEAHFRAEGWTEEVWLGWKERAAFSPKPKTGEQ